MSESLAITWELSTVSGYGIYGFQILFQLMRRQAEAIILTHAPAAVMLPPLLLAKAAPHLRMAEKISDILKNNPNETLAFRHPVLHAAGNDFCGFAGHERITGTPNIGCVALEHKDLSARGLEVAKSYAKHIAISRWNEKFLKEINVAPVHLCYQGIDTSLFFPGPKTGLWKNRFVIFSGGKYEFRKGQDIVVAAFKRFHEKHPEALLVCAWQSLFKPDLAAFEAAGHVKGAPALTNTGMLFAPWLVEQGLPADSFIALPYVPNVLVPTMLRECDLAVFPNRCEGGTNLVAMEAMACGVPTYVANNTGQKDLVDLLGCDGFNDQRPIKPVADTGSLEDWGETALDEVVAAMERVYTSRQEAQKKADRLAQDIKKYDWSIVNDKLLDVIFA